MTFFRTSNKTSSVDRRFLSPDVRLNVLIIRYCPIKMKLFFFSITVLHASYACFSSNDIACCLVIPPAPTNFFFLTFCSPCLAKLSACRRHSYPVSLLYIVWYTRRRKDQPLIINEDITSSLTFVSSNLSRERERSTFTYLSPSANPIATCTAGYCCHSSHFIFH